MADNKRLVIVGIPGVGKTTVISQLLKVLHRKRLDVKHVVFGTVMLDQAIKKYGIRHRDQLRTLPVIDQKRLQIQAANSIAKMRASVLIVDTHLFIKTREGYWPGLPFGVLGALEPTNVILVEATAKEILQRRMRDRNRYRDALDEAGISTELELARTMLATSAILTGAPLLTIQNEETRADKAAREIVSSITFA